MRRPGEVVLSAVCGFLAAALALVLAVAGFIILVRGGVGYSAFVEMWRWSPIFHVTRALLSALVFGGTSFYMLDARRWARDLFVGWSWLQLIVNIYSGPHFRGGWSAVSFVQIILTLVLSYLLLTGSSRDYFSGEQP
jgi:hypothetical protein